MKIFSGGNPSLRIRIAISSLVLMVGVFLLAIECQAEPLLLSAQPVQSIGEVPAGPPDSIVQITAEAQGLPAVAYDNLPPYGTYWEMLPSGLMPPLPFPPTDPTLPIFAIADNIFLVDATGGQVTVHARQLGSMRLTRITTSDATESALEAQATAIVNLINQVQDAQFNQDMAMVFGLDVPSPNGGFGDGSGGDFANIYSAYTFDTNQLWLEITNVSNGWSYLNLHNATNQVYAIWGTTNLLTPFVQWQVETEVWPTDTNCMPFALQNFDRQDLFLRAEDWTRVTENGNTTPDWWFWLYFGTTALSDTNLDAGGNTLLYDYQKGIDPNIIEFSLQFSSYNVNVSPVQGTLDILNGTPAYIAVLVNDTNLADAVWQPYQPNVIASLNFGDGVYTVSVGLRGLPPDATQTWMQRQLTLNTLGPKFIITSPASTTVVVPLIQLQGLVSVPLSALTFDVSNVLGVITNQTGYWNPVFYDTNALAFTTNAFQCYDIPLTNGLNRITLHATDTAGNTTTTNISYTLDYASDTTPPVLSVVWPSDGTTICGSNFTLQAQVDDNTATVTAAIVDANGNTNTVTGLVERSGAVWVNSLPLAAGANALTLTATDAAGNSSTTNLTVYPSSMTVTLDPLTQFNQSSVTVMGAISDPSYDVSVNGVAAHYVDDLGDWEADGVPVSPIGAGVFDVEISGGTGAAMSVQKGSPLRPNYKPSTATTGAEQFPYAQPATVSLMSYTKHHHSELTRYGYCHGGQDLNQYDETENWLYQFGGVNTTVKSGKDGNCNQNNSSYAFSLAGGYKGYTPAWECNDLTVSMDENDTGWGSQNGSSETETQARVMILPAGMAAAGQTALYLVQAQVWDEDSGLQLAAGAVQFMHQLAGTATEDVTHSDGSVWSQGLVSAPAGAPVEVTPQASGNISFAGMKTAKTKEDWQAAVRQEINQDSGYTAVISQYLASNGFSFQNRRDIKAIYAFYQKVYLEQPTEYYWCGLAKLAGAPVYAGLSDAQNAIPILTDFQQTIIQMNIDILNDIAWQFEAYRKGGLQALEAVYAADNQALDISPWQEIDQGIQQNNQTLILEGNEALLQREQQQVLPPDYAELSSLDTTLMSIFAQCPLWNSFSVPYPGRDFSSIMGSGHNVANTTDRWNWIPTPDYGIWDTWGNLSSDDKSSQVSTSLTTRAVTYSTLPSILFNY